MSEETGEETDKRIREFVGKRVEAMQPDNIARFAGIIEREGCAGIVAHLAAMWMPEVVLEIVRAEKAITLPGGE